MPFKSILRAVGARWQGLYPWTRADSRWPLDRLTARRDWQTTPGNEAPYASVGYWDAAGRAREFERTGKDPYAAPPWPVADDPYAKPEPCDVVPDAGKLAIDKLAARGLTGPMPTAQSVTDLITLIERQEAAEKHLKGIGMTYTRERGWHIP